ncbi:MAG: mechanosensitive ion channel family protein [Steroidobacteraceae bacterium]
MNALIAMLDDLYLDNSVSQWLLAIAVTAAAFMCMGFIRRRVRRSYRRYAQTPHIEVMEVVLHIAGKTNLVFLLLVSLFLGSLLLTLPAGVESVSQKIVMIACCWQAGIWATAAALAWLASSRGDAPANVRGSAGTMGVLAVIIRIAIWAVVVLLTLDNFGVNITALVAGLGIGGIAIALALQNVLGDLLASLSIALDEPFVVGDVLKLDDCHGKVERIGIKTTRLRSVNGEQIILANADLLKSRLRNFGQMTERRMVFNIGVTYETPLNKLEQLPVLIRTIVESQTGIRFDRCHLLRFGDSAIEFETAYFVLSAQLMDSMDIQHAINMALLATFAREGIAFAYPTRRVLVERLTEAGA